jgi:outer membrane protein OmpA-like peptidoglycan-associated protein
MHGTERRKAAMIPQQKQRQGRVLSYTALACAVLLSACSTPRTKELVVLLPGEDGQVGAVAIAEPQRTTLLDTPLGAAKIDTEGRVTKGTITEEEVNRTFAQALAAQPPKSLKFILHFLANSTEITSESRSDLADLLAEVARRQAVEVEITGHTDHLGQAATNDRLSQERAEAVRDMLMKSGLQASFIRTVGRGDREPLIPLQPGQKAEPRNRRVEVIVR